MLFRTLFKYFIISIFGRLSYARFIGVKIGDNCRIYIDNWGTEPHLIKIGNNVTITADCILLTHDGSYILKNRLGSNRRYKFGPIVIGSQVFIGTRTIIMPGVTICDNVVIGAGSIVIHNVDTPGVYVGSPIKKIKDFDAWAEA